MNKSYLTHSSLAWASVVAIVAGLALTALATVMALPMWLVPVGYFTALIGSAVLFVGWVRWRMAHPVARP